MHRLNFRSVYVNPVEDIAFTRATRATQNLTDVGLDTIINQTSANTSAQPPPPAMYSTQTWAEPTIQWDMKWPYERAKPNYISVGVTRKQ